MLMTLFHGWIWTHAWASVLYAKYKQIEVENDVFFILSMEGADWFNLLTVWDIASHLNIVHNSLQWVEIPSKYLLMLNASCRHTWFDFLSIPYYRSSVYLKISGTSGWAYLLASLMMISAIIYRYSQDKQEVYIGWSMWSLQKLIKMIWDYKFVWSRK